MAGAMLPPLTDVSEIRRRLLTIFPEGTPRRNYCTREMAARTVFVMLYIGAVEGCGMWMAPKHVYRMGSEQATRRSDADREAYIAAVKQRGSPLSVDRWFQDNTREPIRDAARGIIAATPQELPVLQAVAAAPAPAPAVAGNGGGGTELPVIQ